MSDGDIIRTASVKVDPLSTVRDGYDRWSAIYDHDFNPLPPLEEPIVRDMMGDVCGLSVLDAGCGTGRHTQWLAECGATVTAIDFSPGMLFEAKQKAGTTIVRFIEHDLHKPLPFEDQAFDRIVSGLVLEHIRDLSPLFAEFHRVLKPAGLGTISTMHPAMFLRGSQARFTDPGSGNIIQPGSISHSMSDMLTAMLDAKLSLSEIRESAPDAIFATRFPRSEKYVGWPMVVVFTMKK